MIELHILNAHSKFTPYLEQIKAAFARSVQQVSELLPISGVDVLVCVNPESAIPELGLGGHSPSGDLAILSADLDHANFAKSLETEFPTLLGHELHHCLRWQTVGYGSTLLEALVSEGLACHFETELRPDIIPFYAHALKAAEIPNLMLKASQSLFDSNYNHAEWFFGQGNEIPLYAGYTLGFELVGTYISRHGKKASTL